MYTRTKPEPFTFARAHYFRYLQRSRSYAWLVRCADVLRPQATHLPPGYFVGHSGALLQGLRLGVSCYARVVHEHRRASIIRVDEAVTAFAVKPTPDDPRPLAHCQNPPPFHSPLAQSWLSRSAVYGRCLRFRLASGEH